MTIPTGRQWITASFLGWFSGALLIILTSGLFDALGFEGYQFYLGIGIGTGVGFFQWRALRGAGIGIRWWGSTVYGMAMPFLLIDLLRIKGGVSIPGSSLQVGAAFGGITVSALQTLQLRKSGHIASRWLLSGWAGWVLGTALIAAVDHTRALSDNNMVLFALNLTLILSSGAMLGVVTAPAIREILASSSTRETSQ